MVAIGRLRPFKIMISIVLKVRFAPKSGLSGGSMMEDRFVPIADVEKKTARVVLHSWNSDEIIGVGTGR